jgi:hypothetical protein
VPGAFAQFDLDAGQPPYQRNYALIVSNDSPEIVMSAAGFLPTDVIQQMSFTAKVNASDSDGAPTTVQHIWQPPNGTTGPQVTPLDALATAYQMTIPLSQSDTGILLEAVHGYDIRFWVLRGTVTFIRTLQAGQLFCYLGMTSRSTLGGPPLANEDGAIFVQEGY